VLHRATSKKRKTFYVTGVLQGVWDLAKHVPDILKAFGEELMDTVLNGTHVAHVVDQDLGVIGNAKLLNNYFKSK